MTPQQIQYAIYRRYCLNERNFFAMVPNCYTLLENECDMFGLRKSGLTDEFEIKISRQDFLVDFKKQVRFKGDKKYSDWILKSEAYEKGLMPTNHFWYVAPQGLLKLDEIPKHAGFLEVLPSGTIMARKVAPKTTKIKMSDKDVIHHLSKLSNKFWKDKA